MRQHSIAFTAKNVLTRACLKARTDVLSAAVTIGGIPIGNLSRKRWCNVSLVIVSRLLSLLFKKPRAFPEMCSLHATRLIQKSCAFLKMVA